MNNKRKLLFAFAAVALLSLSACGGKGNEEKSNKNANPYKDLPAETDESILEDLSVVHAKDGVYGNIRLPDESNGARISWWSSDPSVINPKNNRYIDPGEVNRQSQDVEVSLTAQIEKNGAKTKFEQKVLVKASVDALDDDDYEAYLFGHFVGEGDQWGKTIDGQRVTNGEQIFFALADVGQGLHFKDMNGSVGTNYDSLKPVLTSEVGERGVRDPFICRSPEGDSFYLIATDLSVYTRGGWGNNAGQATKTGSHSIILWESHDLVNWTEGRQIKVARDDAGMAWAPEMIFCEETGEYYIFFSSTVLDDYSKGTDAKILERDCVYYTTTRDFVHFGETKKFISNIKYPEGYNNTQETDQYAINNNYRKVIDGSAIKIGDYYYSACKDGGNNENHGGIRIQKTRSLLPEWQERPDDEEEEAVQWEFVQNLADVGFKFDNNNADNKVFEGPEWFIYNKADRKNPDVPEIGLMADYYHNTSIGYVPWATTDVEDVNNANGSWRILQSGSEAGTFNWDNNGNVKRHGTILRITAEEAARLKEAYPISKQFND